MKHKLLFTIGFSLLFSLSAHCQSDTGATTREAKQDLKFTLLSLGSGSTRITYERTTTGFQSAELTIGLVGFGFDIMNHADPKGLLIKAAYKWNVIPMRRANSALAGFYLKPELVFADYDYTYSEDPLPDTRLHTRQAALLGECGYQIVLRWFVFDIYAGVGPTVGNGNRHNYYHSFMRWPEDAPLAYTAGFRLGVAF